MFTKITANLFMDSIEEQLPFWVDTLGFEKTVAVPESEGSNKAGFMILVKDATEIMLQTWKSIDKDIGPIEHVSKTCLFIEVDDIDEIEQRLGAMKRLVERRTTFYGATEVAVEDPAGNIVVFAQFGTSE